ncbi:hypothetical protein THAOC_36554 [Thalassiosira oceanica]|uniref:Uncharacterized protein n=1 Tax=Thalassiosira oceanica TaxID=159749 RepID=K0QZ99_THAOC|nr:hypothetical protein THAOC_36554 [Thalassiosira oceanica]|eukprot:EJK44873.1 hypothetical protein THAOC_36554 [Thalassiosira oceanica]
MRLLGTDAAFFPSRGASRRGIPAGVPPRNGGGPPVPPPVNPAGWRVACDEGPPNEADDRKTAGGSNDGAPPGQERKGNGRCRRRTQSPRCDNQPHEGRRRGTVDEGRGLGGRPQIGGPGLGSRSGYDGLMLSSRASSGPRLGGLGPFRPTPTANRRKTTRK